MPPSPTAVQLASSTTAQPNASYDVVATGATPVEISLDMRYFQGVSPVPQAVVQVGDTVTVRGVGSAPWRVTLDYVNQDSPHAATSPIVIDTTRVPGNQPPGQAWTARLAPMEWHWLASDKLGRVLLAADNPGQLHLSRDGGQTWDPGNSPVQNWVSTSIFHKPSGFDLLGTQDQRIGILAAAYGGGLYEWDSAQGWVAAPSGTAGVDFTQREWEAVAAGQLGVALAAVLNGPIYSRSSGSAPWVPTTLEGGSTPLVSGWRGLARAENGLAVAVSQDGDVYVTTNASAGWVRRDVTVAGGPVNDAWYRTAVARDGSVIAVAGRFTSGLYLSRDRGLTWTRAATPTGDYTALSVSQDGRVIVATLTNNIAGGSGSVQISRDGGQTFATAQMPGTDTNWRAVAMSDDADVLAVAAGTFTALTGQLYTSIGNRTSYATGSLEGAQGTSVDLVFEGWQGFGATWSVRSSSGPLVVK